MKTYLLPLITYPTSTYETTLSQVKPISPRRSWRFLPATKAAMAAPSPGRRVLPNLQKSGSKSENAEIKAGFHWINVIIRKVENDMFTNASILQTVLFPTILHHIVKTGWAYALGSEVSKFCLGTGPISSSSCSISKPAGSLWSHLGSQEGPVGTSSLSELFLLLRDFLCFLAFLCFFLSLRFSSFSSILLSSRFTASMALLLASVSSSSESLKRGGERDQSSGTPPLPISSRCSRRLNWADQKLHRQSINWDVSRFALPYLIQNKSKRPLSRLPLWCPRSEGPWWPSWSFRLEK